MGRTCRCLWAARLPPTATTGTLAAQSSAKARPSSLKAGRPPPFLCRCAVCVPPMSRGHAQSAGFARQKPMYSPQSAPAAPRTQQRAPHFLSGALLFVWEAGPRPLRATPAPRNLRGAPPQQQQQQRITPDRAPAVAVRSSGRASPLAPHLLVRRSLAFPRRLHAPTPAHLRPRRGRRPPIAGQAAHTPPRGARQGAQARAPAAAVASREARISWRIRHGTSHSSSLARASHAHALLAAAMLKMLLLQPGPTLLSAFRLRRSSSARGPPLMWGGEALVLRRAPADHYCGAAVPCIILAAACGPAPAPLPCSAPQPSALPPKRPPLPPPPRRGRPQRAPPPPPRCPRCCCTRGASPRCAGCACGGTCRGRRRRRWYGAGGHARGVVTGRCDGAEPRVGGLAEAFAEPVCFICGLILGTPTISGRCCRAMAAAAVTTGRGRVQASTRMTSADGSCA